MIGFLVQGLVVFLVALAGAWNAWMDTVAIQGDFYRSIIAPRNNYIYLKNRSWVWKWKFIEGGTKKTDKAAYPFSTGILVGFTDFWHYSQMMMLICLGAAMEVAVYAASHGMGMRWGWTVLLSVIFGVGFNFGFRRLYSNDRSDVVYVKPYMKWWVDVRGVLEYYLQRIIVTTMIEPFEWMWHKINKKTNSGLYEKHIESTNIPKF